jgi:hypothetical protein
MSWSSSYVSSPSGLCFTSVLVFLYLTFIIFQDNYVCFLTHHIIDLYPQHGLRVISYSQKRIPEGQWFGCKVFSLIIIHDVSVAIPTNKSAKKSDQNCHQ